MHSSGSSGAEVNYIYQNGLLTKVEVPGSPYVTGYTYTGKLLTGVASTQQGQGIVGYKLVYEYNGGGLLNRLLHYKLDEGGEHLQATITYQYDGKRLPVKVISVQANVTLTWVIDGYSDTCYLEPKVFVTGHSLDELYAIYNFPVLSKLSQVPAKITLITKQGQQAAKVEKIYENVCAVNNKKLEKISMRISFPAFPQYDTGDELHFFYK